MSNHFNPREYANTSFGVKIAVMQDPKRDTPKSRANADRLALAYKSPNPMLALARLEDQACRLPPKPDQYAECGRSGGMAKRGSAPQEAVLKHLEAGPAGSISMAAGTGFSGNACRDACYVLAKRGIVKLEYVTGGNLLATLIPPSERKGPVEADFSRAGHKADSVAKVLVHITARPSSGLQISVELGMHEHAVHRCLKSLVAGGGVVKQRVGLNVLYRLATEARGVAE